jgi:PAS domain S-box-containing protein
MVDFSTDPELRQQNRELKSELSNLRSEYERTIAALQTSLVGLFDWNLETQTVYLSPELLRMLGHEQEAMPSDPTTWLSYIRPDNRFQFEAELREALMYGKTKVQGTFWLVRKDGEERCFLVRAEIERRLRDEVGARRILGMAIDVTDVPISCPA